MTIMLLVIDNYDSFVYNLVHYLQDLGEEVQVVRNDALSVEEALSFGADGIVLSPGPCTPDEAGICVDLVRTAPESLPILGVCLGHQSIGQAFGGKVERAQQIMHGKISTVRHNDEEMFGEIPERFDVVRYHSLSVPRSSLPNELSVTAETEDGEVMAMRHATRPVFGVQFHPESIASEYGHQLLTNFLAHTRKS